MSKIKITQQKKILLTDIKVRIKDFNKKKFKNLYVKNLIIDTILSDEVHKILNSTKINFDYIDIENIKDTVNIENKMKNNEILIINNLDILHKNAAKYKTYCDLLVYKILNGKKVDNMFIVFLDKPLEQLFVNNILYFPSKNKIGMDEEIED